MEFPRLAKTNQESPPDLGYVEGTEKGVEGVWIPEWNQGSARKCGSQEWILHKQPQLISSSDILFHYYRWENEVQREESDLPKVIQLISRKDWIQTQVWDYSTQGLNQHTKMLL